MTGQQRDRRGRFTSGSGAGGAKRRKPGKPAAGKGAIAPVPVRAPVANPEPTAPAAPSGTQAAPVAPRTQTAAERYRRLAPTTPTPPRSAASALPIVEAGLRGDPAARQAAEQVFGPIAWDR